jgi:hypothetical protein
MNALTNRNQPKSTMIKTYGTKNGYNCKGCKYFKRLRLRGDTYFMCTFQKQQFTQKSRVQADSKACNQYVESQG